MNALLLTAALEKNLTKGAKVALITSRMGSIADNSGGMLAYRMSKAPLNMADVSPVGHVGLHRARVQDDHRDEELPLVT